MEPNAEPKLHFPDGMKREDLTDEQAHELAILEASVKLSVAKTVVEELEEELRLLMAETK
jgi:hypothetical protein